MTRLAAATVLALALASILLAFNPAAAHAAETDDARQQALLTQLEAAQQAHRDDPDAYATNLALARAWYDLGLTDDRKAAARAEKRFDQLLDDHPGDAVATAYLGSCRLLHAKREWAPWRKYELSKEGVQLMNTAVDLAPDDMQVRFVRATTTENLPQRFELGDQADADFAWLAERILAGETIDGLPADHAAHALVRHAVRLEAAGQHDDALVAYRHVLMIAPDSRPAATARASIDRIEGFAE